MQSNIVFCLNKKKIQGQQNYRKIFWSQNIKKKNSYFSPFLTFEHIMHWLLLKILIKILTLLILHQLYSNFINLCEEAKIIFVVIIYSFGVVYGAVF
jgi:hypothetical protein